MKIIGIIPARWASTRFEGKVLAEIAGKPMIQHVWERAGKSRLLNSLIIACDDERVFDAAKGFGAVAVMTSAKHLSGTDRIAEAVRDTDAEIIINIQGDEPLIHSSVIDGLAEAISGDKSCSMATVIKIIDIAGDYENPNVVKVVIDGQNNALYFSRSAIPYDREKKGVTCYKHLGIYAYKREFLFTFMNLPKSPLEDAEQLEQLRALEAGYKIKTIKTDIETVGVDTPQDLKQVEKILNSFNG